MDFLSKLISLGQTPTVLLSVFLICFIGYAIGAVKAVNAARLALRGDGTHFVSLDSVIATMNETGRALAAGYRETALAGLATNALTC